MRLGYNTNGFAHHDPLLALEILAELGYRSVALTLDHTLLNPFSPDFPRQLADVRRVLNRKELHSVIETGARFLLDPRHKHEPTLVSPDPADRFRRVRFLQHAIDIAAELNSDCVSFWSGTVHDDASDSAVWERLSRSLPAVLDYAAQKQVAVGFEPEPGMFIDTLAKFDELRQRLAHPQLPLTLDVGHLHCNGEFPIADQIRRYGSQLVNVHIEDMRRGVHEHLQFGDGEMEFGPILAAFREVNYSGGLHVELSRHSHDAPRAAERALTFLTGLHPLAAGGPGAQ